jgi:hypothetical protein
MVFIDIAETISNHVLYPPFAMKADLKNARTSEWGNETPVGALTRVGQGGQFVFGRFCISGGYIDQ